MLVWCLLCLIFLSELVPMVIQSNADKLNPMDRVPTVFYIILASHTMLPTCRLYSTLFGVSISMVDLIFMAVYMSQHQGNEFGTLTKQSMLTNCFIYVSTNLIGLYHQHLTDLAHRHTFLEARKCIEAEISYMKHLQQQTAMKEGLLLKVIPQHLLSDMKKLLNKKLVEPTLTPDQIFDELIVEKHDSVSILFADIVSFTPLTGSMKPEELVITLNELFGRFDDLAQLNHCLRIKILGDCYYCVSGLPVPTQDHAQNCVAMGLHMIKVIRDLRDKTGITTLDMRIGVHTGVVWSGVLGLRKWQYDIWSDDVETANLMESSGQPGKVHITQATKDHLGDSYDVHAAQKDKPDGKLCNQSTYFVVDNALQAIDMEHLIHRINSTRPRRGRIRTHLPKRSLGVRRKMSVMEAVESWGAAVPFDSLSGSMLESTLPPVAEVNRRLEVNFRLDRVHQDEEGFGILTRNKGLHPLSLIFSDWNLEQQYREYSDASFKFYIACTCVIFATVVITQGIILQPTDCFFYVPVIVGSMCFLSALFITIGPLCPCYRKLPLPFLSQISEIKNYATSNFIGKLLLTLTSVLIILAMSNFPLNECLLQSKYKEMENPAHLSMNSSASPSSSSFYPIITVEPSLPADNNTCLFAPYYIYTCMLVLITCTVFLRILFVFKFIVMSFCLILFNIMFYAVYNGLFEHYDRILRYESTILDLKYRGSLYTCILFCTLVILNRQIEASLRLDFLCTEKVKDGELEYRKNELMNELLLQNILPKHVAYTFMKKNRAKDEVYHEQCPNACAMFAAIADFKVSFADEKVTGKECLRLLNEIISAFDQLLVMRLFDGVEKIKTIGSTYMAVSGLNPSDTTADDQKAAKNAELMVRFAFRIMQTLRDLSGDAFCEYKLRIGLCHGEVIAGVVGAQKPQYDTWGDTVNVASRMQSTGVAGRIQVPEQTATLLSSVGINCDYRGERLIKGKGQMHLYLVKNDLTDDNIYYENTKEVNDAETDSFYENTHPKYIIDKKKHMNSQDEIFSNEELDTIYENSDLRTVEPASANDHVSQISTSDRLTTSHTGSSLNDKCDLDCIYENTNIVRNPIFGDLADTPIGLSLNEVKLELHTDRERTINADNYGTF